MRSAQDAYAIGHMTDDQLPPRTARAWVAPLVSTVITLPLAFAAWFFGALSPMSCDSCSEADADRFDRSFDTAWTVLCTGLLTALAALAACWYLSLRHPRTPGRTTLLATLAPAVVGVTFVTFLANVNWPWA